MIKRIVLALLIVLGLTGVATNTHAAEFRVPSSENDSITIGEKETPKNLYTAGGMITVNAPITGDLTVAGGQVNVTGDVADSIFAAGGTVSIRGKIGHTARVAGGDITFSGIVGGDLLIAGGTVTITSEAVINGDVLIAGGQVTIDGVVRGVVRAGSGMVTINNSVGSVRAQVGTLTLGSKAVINGDLIYTADKPATIDEAAKVTGVTTFTKTKNVRSPLGHFVTVAGLLAMLGLIILLLLLVRFRPLFSQGVWTRAMSLPGVAIGYGALGIFVLPMIIIAVAITVVGLPIAAILFFLWVTLMLLAMVYAKLILGVWIVQKLTKSTEAKLDWQAVVVGVLVSGALGLIPFIGWLLNFILFLLAFGVLLGLIAKRESAPTQTV